MAIAENTLYGSFNGTTSVILLSATVRSVVRNVVVRNADTVAATVSLTFNGVQLVTVTLQPGDQLTFDDIQILQIGQSVTGVLSGAITTANPVYAITYAEVS